MSKKAVSLTLDESNVLWLRGRGYGRGNLSAAVDELITEARTGRLGKTMTVRTVVGSIDLPADDPLLERADPAVGDLFKASLSRPLRIQETRDSYGPSRPPGSRHRG
jgi:hypothetical protein